MFHVKHKKGGNDMILEFENHGVIEMCPVGYTAVLEDDEGRCEKYRIVKSDILHHVHYAFKCSDDTFDIPFKTALELNSDTEDLDYAIPTKFYYSGCRVPLSSLGIDMERSCK